MTIWCSVSWVRAGDQRWLTLNLDYERIIYFIPITQLCSNPHISINSKTLLAVLWCKRVVSPEHRALQKKLSTVRCITVHPSLRKTYSSITSPRHVLIIYDVWWLLNVLTKVKVKYGLKVMRREAQQRDCMLKWSHPGLINHCKQVKVYIFGQTEWTHYNK